jgi:hypothetical protein
MVEKQEIVKPMIDDKFWFEYSKNKVTGAMQVRIDAAAKLQTLIIWLWGIYTASASVGIALSKTSYSLPVILFIALPSPILIAAYWLAIWAQIPVTLEVKDVVPKTIKDAYERELGVKNNRINKALLLSFTAALLVSVALIMSSVSKQTNPPNFQAYLHTKNSNSMMAVSGSFPADTTVIVRIAPINKPTAPIESEEFPYVTTKSGELQQSIKLKSAGDKYDVTVEWKDEEGLTRSLKRTVASQGKGKEKPIEK